MTALALGLVVASLARAQTLFQGRIDVTVQDPNGGFLPGALVEIAGPQAQRQTTDDRGEAHFLSLPPGVYSMAVSLDGFRTYRNDRIDVASATATALPVTLTVGGVQETVDVSAAAPVIDPTRQTATTSVSYEELQKIPSSRDPWVVLQTIPGIVVDRVNVGGAESGQQSTYLAKGAPGTDRQGESPEGDLRRRL